MAETKPTASRRTFTDPDEARCAAREFLAQGLKRCHKKPIDLKWLDIEGGNGQIGFIIAGGEIIATCSVIHGRDNECLMSGTIFI